MMVNFENDWDKVLEGEFDKDYYKELRQFLIGEYRTQIIHPSMYDIFNAMKTVPYEDVKIVILGQDPYHGPDQAHGMSFSVRPGIPAPPSLQNIFKEIRDDVGCTIPNHGYLMEWAQQGVLLLNAVLTVREGQANSHRGHGWEIFTDRVIGKLSERDKPMVFLLWGGNARSKKSLIDGSRHLILESAHPSPLSAYRGFFGCRHFSKANDFLMKNGMEPVNWQLHPLEK
ncbi:MAG: uracil-DNA glycosylase [Clostridia bacterium]|nr:uracil-DNA glycosylase [Clostridia bacterium]